MTVLYGIQLLHPQTGEVMATKWLPLEDARRWLTPYYGPCSLADVVRDGEEERVLNDEDIVALAPKTPWSSGIGTREHPIEVRRDTAEGRQFIHGLKDGIGWRFERDRR